MSRTVQINAEINVHQAVRAIREFAKGSFGDNNGWLTENEAVDLLAAAEVIHQNVLKRQVNVLAPKSTAPVCDFCKRPAMIHDGHWVHVDHEDFMHCMNPNMGFCQVQGKSEVH